MVGGYGAPKLAFAPLFILWFGIGIAAKIGVEAGANWTTFKDKPHFDYRPMDLTLVEARERFEANGTVFI
jgi:hypothetical protein